MRLLMQIPIWKAVSIILLSMTGLTACVSMPAPGEKFVMVVTGFPAIRQQLQDYPGLSLALKRGVTEEDVSAGRLVRTGCYIQKAGPAGRRFGFTLLPEGVKVARHEVITISAEEADGTDGPYARFFGRYLRKYSAVGADYFDDAIFGKAFRCGPVSSTGEMQVAVISPVHSWDYAFAKAEAARNSEISDAELRTGRIVMGECSPGGDSWILWKVRIPIGMDVKVGDYIEAIAGSHDGSVSVGPISEAIRRISPPRKGDFIRTQGRDTVSCSAHAEAPIGN